MIQNEKIYTIPSDKFDRVEQDLVGVHTKIFGQIMKSNIGIAQGFVVTTHAFDNFLIANDMVETLNEKLSQINTNKISAIQKVSIEIGQLFKEAVMPSSIYDAIRQSYARLSNFHPAVVSIQPSWIDEIHKFSGDIDHKYSFSNIADLNELEKCIKEAWQALFDAKAIFERFENDYIGNLSIALYIQKAVNAEVSGRATSYNPITNNKDEIEIEAVLGIPKGIDELELTPDRYIASKDSCAIVEKNTVGQEKMMIQKGFFKPGEKSEMVVEISKPYRLRQKISDVMILQLANIIKTVEIEAGRIVEVSWEASMGKIYITKVKLGQSLHDFNKHLEIQSDHGFVKKPEIEIISADQIQEKSIEDYVQEIEEKIEDLEKFHTDDEQNTQDLKIAGEVIQQDLQIGSSVKLPISEKDKLPSIFEKVESLKPKKENIWRKYRFSAYKPEVKTVIKIWLDLSEDIPREELNSNEFDGVYGLNGEDLVTGFGHNLKEINPNQMPILKDYISDHIFSLINQDLNLYSMYSLSILNKNQTEKFFPSDIYGIDAHINDPSLAITEFEAINEIRGHRGYRKIWLGIRDVSQPEQFEEIKKIMHQTGLRRSSMFKVFLEADKLPVFLNISDYLELGVDGVILYLDVLFHELLGDKISMEDMLEKEIFWDLFEKLANDINKKKIPFFVKSKFIHKDEELLMRLLKAGINGICASSTQLYDLRKLVQKIEIKVLRKIR